MEGDEIGRAEDARRASRAAFRTSHYVGRPRLDAAVDQLRTGARRAVTVWSAAGSGKSTLLAAWAAALEAEGREVVWLTGAMVSRSPDRLRRPATTPRLSEQQTGDGMAGPSRVVFVDDAHLAGGSRAAGVIAEAIEKLAPGTAIVVAGRFQPFPSLLYLQATADLVELRTADLAFDAAEASALAERCDYTMHPDIAAALVRRTGGWATALVLAIPWLRDSPEAWKAVARFDGDHRAVADYLVDEVIGSLSGDEQAVLLSTAVRDVVPFGLDAELSDRPNAGELLRRISERNSLITEDAEGYRFHPVLLSYLQAEARRRNAGEFADAHVRASHWFAERGDGTRALQEAIASGRQPAMVATIERFGLELMLSGESELILRAVASMPGEDMSLPVLATHLLLEAPDFADARRADHLFAEALGYDVPGSACDRWLAVVVALHCFEARSEIPLGERAARLRRDDITALRRDDLELDLLAATAEAWTVGRLGDPGRAERLLRETAGSTHRAGLLWLFLVAMDLAARAAALAGQWDRAAAFEDQISAEVLADGHPLRDRVRAAATVVAAGRAFRRCEHLPVDRLDEIVAADPLGTTYGLLVPAQALRTFPALDADPNPRAALETLDDLYRTHGDRFPRLFATVALRMVSLRLSLDGRTLAKELADELCHTLGEHSVEAHLLRFALNLPTRVGDSAEEPLLAALEQRSRAWHPGAPISAWILLAVAAEQQGRRAEADARLTTAVRLAHRVGSLQPFAARGGEGADLLETRIGRLGHLDGFARRLRQAVSDTLPGRSSAPSVLESLTPREHGILNELPVHQSVAEIARKQTLSVNTVKTHLRSIYQKLGVSDRSEAVAAAQERGLL
jgi:ATP/maltotriose-dependent transcriptional regulator MalT